MSHKDFAETMRQIEATNIAAGKCPKCGQSFAPNTTVAVAVHLTEGKQ